MTWIGLFPRLRRSQKNAANIPPPPPPPTEFCNSSKPSKVKTRGGGARLWLRFKRNGESMLKDYERNEVTKSLPIPCRDLRILGPVFSNCSNVLAREKAMVINLDFVKAVVTHEEVMLLDPTRQEVIPIVDQLRQIIPRKTRQSGLPFEFQVLEIALDVLCTRFDSSVLELEKEAYPVLDELAWHVNIKNLEHVRTLKTKVAHLLARVQKVRDEIEHILDDGEDMACLYLTRRWIQNHQFEALSGAAVSDSIINSRKSMKQLKNNLSENNVEDLEMLLESYFVLLDRTRNKILCVREYIDDTEDYVRLSSQRNELLQFQLVLAIATFAIALDTVITGIFGMNIPCSLYEVKGLFWPFVYGSSAVCLVVFLLLLGYARWKKLIAF